VIGRRSPGWMRFGRGSAADALPIRLDRRRIYILPTRQGLFFAMILGLMLLGAINYDNSLAYALTFLLGSVGVVSILHTWGNLLGLRIGLGPVPPVFAGATLEVPVVLDNRGATARYGIELRFEHGPAVVCDLAADTWTTLTVPHPTTRRGRHALHRLRIASRFPLGLLRAWTPMELGTDYLAYPTPALRSGMPPEVAWVSSLSGDRGIGSDDFAGFRAYQAGDSLRHVNWKAVSRGHGLNTKVFGGDRTERLLIDWRARPELQREARLSRMTRAILEAESGGRDYGLWLPGVAIRPDRGAAHQRRCLEALAMFEAPG